MSAPELVEVDYEALEGRERYYYLNRDGVLQWARALGDPPDVPLYRLVVPVEPVELPEGWQPSRFDNAAYMEEVGEYLTRETVEKIVADAPQVLAWMEEAGRLHKPYLGEVNSPLDHTEQT